MSLADGARLSLLRVTVNGQSNETLKLPGQLSTITRLSAGDAINRSHPRTFRVTMERICWDFNGRSYQINAAAPDGIVNLGATEICEFVNNMMMAHAIHVQGLQFPTRCTPVGLQACRSD